MTSRRRTQHARSDDGEAVASQHSGTQNFEDLPTHWILHEIAGFRVRLESRKKLKPYLEGKVEAIASKPKPLPEFRKWLASSSVEKQINLLQKKKKLEQQKEVLSTGVGGSGRID